MTKEFIDTVLSSEKLSQGEKDEFLKRIKEEARLEAHRKQFVYDYVLGNHNIYGWSNMTLDNISKEKELKDEFHGIIHYMYKIKGEHISISTTQWLFEIVTYSDGAMLLSAYHQENIRWRHEETFG